MEHGEVAGSRGAHAVPRPDSQLSGREASLGSVPQNAVRFSPPGMNSALQAIHLILMPPGERLANDRHSVACSAS